MDAPDILCDFLSYHESVRGHSQKTVDEYYLDLRTMFRYLKLRKGLVPDDTPFDEIPIRDVDVNFISDITLNDIYDYLTFLSRERGLNTASRARKVSTIRSFFKYMTNKTHQLSFNPVEDLDPPKILKALPKYLSLDESIQLLNSVQGRYQERDYCILILFLNCGLRISELVSLNTTDIHDDHIRVLGKGNKERVVYFDARTKIHLQNYLNSRTDDNPALFVSLKAPHERLKIGGIETRLREFGKQLGLHKVHPHKFRRTLATMAIDKGMPIEQLQQLLGHRKIDTTLQYAMVKQSNVKIAHRKYIG